MFVADALVDLVEEFEILAELADEACQCSAVELVLGRPLGPAPSPW